MPDVDQLQQHFVEYAQTLDTDRGKLHAALVQAGLQILLAPNITDVTPDDFAAIRRAYPAATPAGARAHRLTHQGVVELLGVFSVAARKYLDHQPEADFTALRAQDQSGPMPHLNKLGDYIGESFPRLADQGATTFGTYLTAIMHATLHAERHGLPLVLIANTLLEALAHAAQAAEPGQPRAAQRDLAIGAIAQQLGVSLRTARKYYDEANGRGPRRR